MNRILEKNDRGLMDILQFLNLMKDKNDLFLHGTFNWLLYTHPPFPGSHIVFNYEKNEYKHWKISTDETYSLFKDFRPGHYIKELTFSYSTIAPYHIIIGKSDWINNLLDQNVKHEEIEKWIKNWIDFYHRTVEKEREHFRSLISFYRPQQSLPLF